MKPILVFLLLIATGTAYADADTRDKLNQLRTALDGVRQEQQSVYQNYQMARELRLTEVQEGMPPRAAALRHGPQHPAAELRRCSP